MDEVRWRRPTFWSERRSERTFSTAACPIVAMKEANLVTAPPPSPTGCLSLFPGSVLLHYIWDTKLWTHKKKQGATHTQKMRRWGKQEVAEGATMGPRGREMRISTPPLPTNNHKGQKKKTNNMALGWELLEGNNQSSELIALMTQSSFCPESISVSTSPPKIWPKVWCRDDVKYLIC